MGTRGGGGICRRGDSAGVGINAAHEVRVYRLDEFKSRPRRDAIYLSKAVTHGNRHVPGYFEATISSYLGRVSRQAGCLHLVVARVCCSASSSCMFSAKTWQNQRNQG